MTSPQRWAERARVERPGELDPTVLRWFRRLAGPVLRLMHRPTMRGAEHIPRDRPFMLVANHSGAIAISEIACLVLLTDRDLPGLRVAGFAHPAAFHFWPLPLLMRWTGAIPASYAAAHQALESGVSLLVFPGGDYEASRPIWQANRVDWNGRTGFLKIAREAGVPIVPMGIRGSHWTAPVLWRSSWLWPRLLVLPRVFGLKRWPVTFLGVAGLVALGVWAAPAIGWPLTALAGWVWMISLVPLLPYVPATVRFRVGRPIEPDALAQDDLAAAYERVRGAVQALVDGP